MQLIWSHTCLITSYVKQRTIGQSQINMGPRQIKLPKTNVLEIKTIAC